MRKKVNNIARINNIEMSLNLITLFKIQRFSLSIVSFFCSEKVNLASFFNMVENEELRKA